MPRLLYLTNSNVPSTSANSVHVMKMAQAFSKKGFKTDLWLSPSSSRLTIQVEDVYKFYDVDKSFRIIDRPKGNSILEKIIRKLKLDLLIYLIRYKPDIIYGRNCELTLFCAKIGYRVILELHHPLQDKQIKLINVLIRRDKIIKIVSITKALKSLVLKQFSNLPKNTIIVEPDAIDIERFEGMIDNKKMKMKLGFQDSDYIIGYFGALLRGRGINLIIEIASKLPNFQFIIIGGRTEKRINEIKRMKMKECLDNVTIYGFISNSELRNYYSICDILLMPYQRKVELSGGGDTSKWMSPLKMFEYMATGKEIISSNLEVLKEILINRRNCILVDPDNVTQWIEAIRQIEAMGPRFGKNAVEDVKKYTWNKRVLRILSIDGIYCR